MENDLISQYKKANKQIIGLEESKDLLSQVIEFNSYFEQLNEKELKNFHLERKKNRLNANQYYAEGRCLLISPSNSSAVAERNRNWFPKIITETDNNDLIAVGLNHLTNPDDGLLNWLEENGYIIKKCDQFTNFSSYTYKKQGPCKIQ